MINCFVGRPGVGKTYALVRMLRQQLKKGRTCYWQRFLPINLEILESLYWHERVFDFFYKFFNKEYVRKWGELKYYDSVNDFYRAENGVFFMDEIQMYFNARLWATMPIQVQWKLQQHRKDGLDIWGTTQNIKRVDPVVRELVNSLFPVKKIGKLFIWNEYDVVDIDKEKRVSFQRGYFWLDKKICDSYNTYQKVKPF